MPIFYPVLAFKSRVSSLLSHRRSLITSALVARTITNDLFNFDDKNDLVLNALCILVYPTETDSLAMEEIVYRAKIIREIVNMTNSLESGSTNDYMDYR